MTGIRVETRADRAGLQIQTPGLQLNRQPPEYSVLDEINYPAIAMLLPLLRAGLEFRSSPC